MIDFACKEFKIEDVIKCALNLTRADLKVMKFFINHEEEGLSTEALSQALELDLSTVQRSVKKLYEKEVLRRVQQNLDGGGYVFIYRGQPKSEIRGVIMEIVRTWVDRVEKEFEEWDHKL
ncbi:MAG: MarR family transcriptional regulator [Methanosarcinaceae archaeon]|nr:MarR family transcriptional regulator [Methanosarcinaceae archaeon]MDD4331863.1 MarR family transcriptional regulator [Methanosarcinaceae archaeon]MDD4749360.1 MarR family transcriptional regulator [Methanosarcinaceae archaeon]